MRILLLVLLAGCSQSQPEPPTIPIETLMRESAWSQMTRCSDLGLGSAVYSGHDAQGQPTVTKVMCTTEAGELIPVPEGRA